MTAPDFIARWQTVGGAERANFALFLQELGALLGVAPPDPVTVDPTQNAYVLERAATIDDGQGRTTTGRIDLHKRGCFVLETKQGTTSLTDEALLLTE
jgi:hypothetical protein